ncbi:MAG: chemotaxis protein CheD [Oscillospiraceae bacterium]|nr:chemotaxis protein CheD [Oscillospiraceae bacterium]
MASITVGISDLKLANPPDTLITYALGSCVGICLLDPITRVGGLSHIMLPSSAAVTGDLNVMKFADTAIPDLIKKMERKGASRTRLKAKIAGGAQMFGAGQTGGTASNDMWQIGQRNVQAVTAILQKIGIPIIAKDVLSNYGRTVLFDPATGIMTVKSLNKNVKEL